MLLPAAVGTLSRESRREVRTSTLCRAALVTCYSTLNVIYEFILLLQSSYYANRVLVPFPFFAHGVVVCLGGVVVVRKYGTVLSLEYILLKQENSPSL